MRKDRLKIVFCIFVVVLSALPTNISNSRADVVQVDTKGTGHFLPIENCSLIMTNASIIFNIEHKTSRIDVEFEGNYIIYNPDESTNITLAAPFSTGLYNLESTSIVKIGGIITPFSIVEIESDEQPWSQYLESSHEGTHRRKLIVINTTVPENSSIELEYVFDAYTADPNSVDGIEIYYDVGTSRVWNGSITERVEFRVHGKLPDSYSHTYSSYLGDVIDYNCTVTNIENGKSYLWEWLNEVITADAVFIAYSNPWRYIWGRIAPFIIVPLVLLPLIISVVIIRRRAKRRKAVDQLKV